MYQIFCTVAIKLQPNLPLTVEEKNCIVYSCLTNRHRKYACINLDLLSLTIMTNLIISLCSKFKSFTNVTATLNPV